MEKVKLLGWKQIEDGMMGKFELEDSIPINVCVDNYDELDNKNQETYSIEIFAVGQGLQIFESEEEYYSSGSSMGVESMIPAGTFPAQGYEEGFEESPQIYFTGQVLEVDYNPEASEMEPNIQLRIKTFGMEFTVYWHTDEKVEIGYVVHGGAWLFGDAVES